MTRAVLLGTFWLGLLAMAGCGPAPAPRSPAPAAARVTGREMPEPTEEERRLYRGTGEDLEDQQDAAAFAAAVGLSGSAEGRGCLLTVCGEVGRRSR